MRIETTVPIPRKLNLEQALAYAADVFEGFRDKGWEVCDTWMLSLSKPRELSFIVERVVNEPQELTDEEVEEYKQRFIKAMKGANIKPHYVEDEAKAFHRKPLGSLYEKANKLKIFYQFLPSAQREQLEAGKLSIFYNLADVAWQINSDPPFFAENIRTQAQRDV